MTDDIIAAVEAALGRIQEADTLEAVEAVSAETLGKKGVLGELKSSLSKVDEIEERKLLGRALNEAFASVGAAIDERRSQLVAQERSARVQAERLDLTEALAQANRGHLHLVTQAWQELEDVFVGLGFTVAEGPEVETDWHNFEALNMGRGTRLEASLTLCSSVTMSMSGRAILAYFFGPTHRRFRFEQCSNLSHRFISLRLAGCFAAIRPTRPTCRSFIRSRGSWLTATSRWLI